MRKATAAPRGCGKSRWCIVNIIHAIVYGRRKFVVYICEKKDLAKDRLQIIKAVFEKNNLLMEDFPRICACVRALQGRPQRALSQTHKGKLTHIVWSADEVVFPSIPKSLSSGSRIIISGATASIRGILTEHGRPDLIVIDDPAGDESAVSGSQIEKRRKLIRKGLSQLGELGSTMSMLMLCTIIEIGDIADEFTDRTKEPAWNGSRSKFLESMPENLDLWNEYVRLRREKNTDKDPFSREAHRFYLSNREKMDAGAICSLPWAFAGKHVVIPPAVETKNLCPDGSEIEASAIQHAFNVIADDGEETFYSELQNDPQIDQEPEDRLTRDMVMLRVNNRRRREIPEETTSLVSFWDVGLDKIHYVVLALWPGFSGAVVDYGVYPPGRKTLRDGMIDPRDPKSKERAIIEGLRYVRDFLEKIPLAHRRVRV